MDVEELARVVSGVSADVGQDLQRLAIENAHDLVRSVDEIEELQEDHNEGLTVEGIVVNQFQPRAALPLQMVNELLAEGLPVLPVHLMSSVRMRESHQVCMPLIHFDPRHKLTQQFVELHGYLES